MTMVIGQDQGKDLERARARGRAGIREEVVPNTEI